MSVGCLQGFFWGHDISLDSGEEVFANVQSLQLGSETKATNKSKQSFGIHQAWVQIPVPPFAKEESSGNL